MFRHAPPRQRIVKIEIFNYRGKYGILANGGVLYDADFTREEAEAYAAAVQSGAQSYEEATAMIERQRNTQTTQTA